MSRVGKQPIKKPNDVNISVDNGFVVVKGSKGELKRPLIEGITITDEEGQIAVSRSNDEASQRAKHGLMRALVQNMVDGVSKGFDKQLEINGVGFRVNLAGRDLKMNLGFSHEVVYSLPEGLNAKVEQNKITISGIDKQLVNQSAAEIRTLRKPEPYKGKGIKYVDERILRKSGKSGKE